jgi:hypothetical protein
MLPCDRPREALVPAILDVLRHRGMRVHAGTGWEDYDATICASRLVEGRLVTSAHPEGAVQLRIRPALRVRRFLAALAATALVALFAPAAALIGALIVVGDLALGAWWVGPFTRRVVAEADA